MAGPISYRDYAPWELDQEMEEQASKTFLGTSGDARDFDASYPSQKAKQFGVNNSDAQTKAFIDRINSQSDSADRVEIPNQYRDGVDHAAINGIRAERAANNQQGVQDHKDALSSRLRAASATSDQVMRREEASSASVKAFISNNDFGDKTLKSTPSYLLREAQKEALAKDNEVAVNAIGDEVGRRERIAERYSEMGSEDLKDRLESMNPEVFYDLMVGNAATEEDRQRNADIYFEGVDERLSGKAKMAAIGFAARYSREESAIARRMDDIKQDVVEAGQGLAENEGSDLTKSREALALDLAKTNNQSSESAITQEDRIRAVINTSQKGVQRLHERNNTVDPSSTEGRSAIKEELAAIRSRQELLKNDSDGSIQEFNGTAEGYRRQLLVDAGRSTASCSARVSMLENQGEFRLAQDTQDAFDSRFYGTEASRAKMAGDSGKALEFSGIANRASSSLDQRVFRDQEYTTLQKRFEQKASAADLTEIEMKEVEKMSEKNLQATGNISSDLSKISAQSSLSRELTDEQRSAVTQVSIAEMRGEDALDELESQSVTEESSEIEASQAELDRDEAISQIAQSSRFDERIEKLEEKGISAEEAYERVANNTYASQSIREAADNIAEDKSNQERLESAMETGDEQGIDEANDHQELIDASREDDQQHLKNLLELEGEDRLQKQIEKVREADERKLEKMQEREEKLEKASERSDDRLQNLNDEIERQTKSGASEQDISDLEDERIMELEKNEDLHAKHEVMQQQIDDQQQRIESMEEVSQEVQRLAQEQQQEQAEKLNEEAAEQQQKIDEENQQKADEVQQLKEDEAEYQDEDLIIDLAADKEEQRLDEEKKEAESQAQDEQEMEAQEESLDQEEDLALSDEQENETEAQEESLDQEEDLTLSDDQQNNDVDLDLSSDSDDAGSDDTNPDTNKKEDTSMNYSQVKAQEVDAQVAQSVESGEYDEIKSEAFNRENSDMLSMLSSDIKSQQEQKQEQAQNQSQTQKNDEIEDQSQKQQNTLSQ